MRKHFSNDLRGSNGHEADKDFVYQRRQACGVDVYRGQMRRNWILPQSM